MWREIEADDGSQSLEKEEEKKIIGKNSNPKKN
jgi:hypothetical protein